MTSEEPGPSKKRAKTDNFHQERESEFLFPNIKEKSICLNCHQSVALSKTGHLERHQKRMHAKFQEFFFTLNRNYDEENWGVKGNFPLF